MPGLGCDANFADIIYYTTKFKTSYEINIQITNIPVAGT